MTDDPPLVGTVLAEALAEIDRLRARVTGLEVGAVEQARVISRQLTRITELEAALAVARGTLAQPTPTPDEPMTIVHDVPPSAPPHGE